MRRPLRLLAALCVLAGCSTTRDKPEVKAPRPEAGTPTASTAPAKAAAAPAAPTALEDTLTGPITYFCDCAEGAGAGCAPGADDAEGTIEAPLRSSKRLEAMVERAAPGDRFLLCRGGAWRRSVWLRRVYHSGPPVHVGAYGEGPVPTIFATDVNEPGLNLSYPGKGGRYGNILITDLRLVGPKGVTQAGVFTHNQIDDITLRRLEVSHFDIGVQVAGGHRMKVDSCHIHDNRNVGFLGGGNGIQLVNSRYDNNGFAQGILGHNIYITGGDDVVIRNNHLTRSALNDKGACSGVSLSVHGWKTRNLLVEGNRIEERSATQSCWGIAVDAHSDGARGHDGARIIGNQLSGVGNVAITVAACKACEIRDNRLEASTAFGTTMIQAPRPGVKEPQPTTDLKVTGNRITSKRGRGTCFDLDPKVVAASDDNQCRGLSWSAKGTLKQWRQRVKLDLKSQHQR